MKIQNRKSFIKCQNQKFKHIKRMETFQAAIKNTSSMKNRQQYAQRRKE